MSEEVETKKSALAVLAEIPRVGLNNDLELGFAHLDALRLASDNLQEISDETQKNIFKCVFKIFEEWKIEHGIFPPYGPLFGLGATKQESAKEYIKKQHLIAKLRGEEFEEPNAWECCPFVSTPVGLFEKLVGEKYKPLLSFVEKNTGDYDKILSLLILSSHRGKSNSQTGDCINAALKLARFKLSIQKNLIDGMKPAAEADFNRRKQKRINETIRNQQDRQTILNCIREIEKEGKRPALKEIAARTKKSQSVISRHLQAAGLGRYKQK